MNKRIIYYRNAEELDTHIKIYHGRSKVSEYLQEIVYGGGDGIVTTLAVISGFAGAGAQGSNLTYVTVLLFGLANLFGDATSMGLSNFLSQRSEQAVAKKQLQKQQLEISCDQEKAEKELQVLLNDEGFDPASSQRLSREIKDNPNFMSKFMLNKETGLSVDESSTPTLSSIFTFASFIFFGAFPLLPYIFNIQENAFLLAILSSILSIILLGVIRLKVTKEPWWKAIGETLLVCSVSASVAFIVGTFFG